MFLKVIYACVEQENILPLPAPETTSSPSTTERDQFTGGIVKHYDSTINRDDDPEEITVKAVEDQDEKENSEMKEMFGSEMMSDKKMIYSSELKYLSETADQKIFGEDRGREVTIINAGLNGEDSHETEDQRNRLLEVSSTCGELVLLSSIY